MSKKIFFILIFGLLWTTYYNQVSGQDKGTTEFIATVDGVFPPQNIDGVTVIINGVSYPFIPGSIPGTGTIELPAAVGGTAYTFTVEHPEYEYVRHTYMTNGQEYPQPNRITVWPGQDYGYVLCMKRKKLDEFRVNFKITDEEGTLLTSYSFFLEGVPSATNRVLTAKEYKYTVSKPGFHTSQGTVDILSDTTINIKIFPENKEPQVRVSFSVDKFQMPPPPPKYVDIDDATITLDEHVNSQGDYLFYAPLGEHRVLIEHQGSVIYSARFTLNKDTVIKASAFPMLPPPIPVKFNIYDESGNALPGATIVFGDTETGNYEVGSFATGKYPYKVSLSGYGTVSGTAIVFAEGTSTGFVTNEFNITLSKAYKVTFDVKSGTGAPIPPPMTMYGSTITLGDITNAANDYDFEVAPGSYKYYIKNLNFYYPDQSGFVEVTRDTVIDILVLPGGKPATVPIIFHITDQRENPVEDAVIHFNGFSQTSPEFTEVPIGMTPFSITKDGYETYNGEILVVDGAPDVKVTIRKLYKTTFNIEGVDLKNGVTETIGDAVITIDGKTYAPGHYVFYLAHGNHQYLVETPEKYQNASGAFAATSDNDFLNISVDAEAKELVNVKIVPVDKNGRLPLENILITLNGKVQDSGTFNGMAEGVYTYIVESEGYLQEEGSLFITKDNNTHVIEMTRLYQVTFKVKTSMGTPMPPPMDNTKGIVFLGEEISKEEGDYIFHVPAGSYKYFVTIPSVAHLYAPVSGVLSVTSDMEVESICVMDMSGTPPTTDVEFVITDQNGYPLDGASIIFDDVPVPFPLYTVTGVPAGYYSYAVSLDGYETVSRFTLVVIEDNYKNTVEVTMQKLVSATFDIQYLDVDGNYITIPDAEITLNGNTNPVGDYVFSNLKERELNYTVSGKYFKNATGTTMNFGKDIKISIVLEPEALVVTTFNINNDARVTSNRQINLISDVQGIPTHYMVSENENFENAQWSVYSPSPVYNFVDNTNGMKTVYFKLKNNEGETAVFSDEIYYKAEPVKLALNLNKGAVNTTERMITLDHMVRNFTPTKFSVAEDPARIGEEWHDYEAVPVYELSAGTGMKSVYFAVANEYEVSETAEASIYYDESATVKRSGMDAKLYPNPAIDYVNVMLEDDMLQAKVTIYTLNGKVVAERVYTDRSFSVELNECPSGILLIRISSGDKYVVKRIIKQ